LKNFLSRIFRKRAAAPPAPPAGKEAPPNTIILREEAGSDKLVFKNLLLLGADNAPMIDYGSVTLVPGDRMMLKGPAGCGKSAGMAALRNAWLLGGSGEITAPPEIRFVPQEEYFPNRTLRGIVSAPDIVSRFTQEQVTQALINAGLEEFVALMDDPAKKGEYWRNTLSGGQKNKLALAGIFLHAAETKLLIVDEVSAALDAKSEAELYPKLLEHMRHGIIISIAHHDSIAPLHNIFATVAEGKVFYTKTPPEAPVSPKKDPPGPEKLI